MKKFYLLIWCSFAFLSGGFAQTAIDATEGGFDAGSTFAANGWTVVNSSANKWVVGSTTFYSAPNSAYISQDGNVANYDYDNTKAHISHFYRQITLPPEAFNISLSFFLKGNVQSDSSLDVIDGLIVYSDVVAPVADALPGPSSVVRFSQFNSQLNYTQQVLGLPDLVGKTFFLIFTWVNNGDGIGAGPPASVDGISLTYCIKATNYSVTGGGAFCTGSSGVGVGLAGSTKGINYQLYNNGVAVGGLVAGTGSPIDFGTQNIVGKYTVVGTSECANTYPMTGFVNVTETPLPVATAGNNSPLCLGSTLNLTAGGGTSYNWTGPNSFTASIQNPSITNVTAAAAGSYTVTVTANNCSASATTIVTLTTSGLTGGTIASVSTCSNGSGTLTLSGNSNAPTGWEYSTDSTSASWTAIPNTGTTQAFANITVPTFYRAVVSNGCGIVKSSIATVRIHNYWTGAGIINPTDWNKAGNWSDSLVPSTLCLDVYIPNTPNKPVLSSGPVATITNLHIFAGAVVTINGTGLLQIGGTISNSGIFDVTNGSVELNGTGAPQNIDGSLFKDSTVKNLIISNTVDVANTVKDTLNISGTLSFNTPTAQLNTGNNITLKSSVATTANVGMLTVGNAITGNVTVERYINIGPGKHAKAWEFLATPAKGQSVHDSWMEKGLAPPGYGTQITGKGGMGAGFDMYTPSPSMKYYDPSNSLGWTGIANTTILIYDQRGYMLFVRGDRSVNGSTVTTANPTTLRITGQLNVGQVTMTVSANSFASIGNPYASAIDMKKVMADKSWINDDFFTVWNSNLGGSYGLGAYTTYLKSGTDYINVPGDGTINDYIQSGQAFFVQNTSGTAGSMVFKEASKANVNTGFIDYFRPLGIAGRIAQLRTNLYVLNADGTKTLADGTLQQFSDEYSNGLDGLDGRKIFNSSENLSIKSGGKDLIVERKQLPTEQDTVFYSLTSVKVGNYHFEFTANNLSANGLQGFVEDTYLNTRTPLNLEGKTTLDFAVTTVAGSYAANRFRIVYKTMVALPVKIISLAAYEKNADIVVEWKVENETNLDHYEVEKSTDGIHFTRISMKTPMANNGGSAVYLITDVDPVEGYNYYRVKSVDIDGSTAYTNVVKVMMSNRKENITIYPNPITDGIIHLQLMNQPEGRYGIRLLNKLGQVIIQKQINHPQGSSTEFIQWDYNLAHGIYQLEIIKPDGSVKDLNVMY